MLSNRLAGLLAAPRPRGDDGLLLTFATCQNIAQPSTLLAVMVKDSTIPDQPECRLALLPPSMTVAPRIHRWWQSPFWVTLMPSILLQLLNNFPVAAHKALTLMESIVTEIGAGCPHVRPAFEAPETSRPKKRYAV
jgi:hypothetical protein